MKLLSSYLNFTDELENCGVLDSSLDEDLNLFINILRLKQSKTPEFKNSYDRINNFFKDIIVLLDAAHNNDDNFCRRAYRLFDFSEVNETNLGFAKSTSGQGFGHTLRKQVISQAFDIVKAGNKQPEIFHLMQLFEDNVGPDRISDMISTIIRPDLEAYTLRVLKELGITRTSYPKLEFDKEGFLLNPYKSQKGKHIRIYFLPTEILQDLPIAHSWDEIDDVISKNEAIKREINIEIGNEWSKYSSYMKKKYIREEIFENQQRCSRVINAYREESTKEIDLTDPKTYSTSPDYYVAKIAKNLNDEHFAFTLKTNSTGGAVNSADPSVIKREVNSHSVTIDMLDYFGEFVYNHKGWELIQSFSTGEAEKFTQRIIDGCCRKIVEENEFDISFEPNEGPGPADIKVSRGSDKTVIEVKLSTNGEYIHGFDTQLPRYAETEKARFMVLLFIDKGNPGRLKSLKKRCDELQFSDDYCPELYLVDARKQKSANKLDFSMGAHYGLYEFGSYFAW